MKVVGVVENVEHRVKSATHSAFSLPRHVALALALRLHQIQSFVISFFPNYSQLQSANFLGMCDKLKAIRKAATAGATGGGGDKDMDGKRSDLQDSQV